MFKSIRVGSVKRGTIVVGAFSPPTSGIEWPKELRTDDRAALQKAAKTPGFKAECGEICSTADGHLLIGLGKKTELNAQSLRTAGARLIKKLDRMGVSSARLHIASMAASRSLNAAECARALGEGMGLANWRVDFFTGKATKVTPPHAALTIEEAGKGANAGLAEGLDMASHVNVARRMAATPPNVCNPAWVAAEAKKIARQTGMKCTVIDYAKAVKLGMGGIVNVGRGSSAKPCLVILEHKPRTIARAARGKSLALVGKTVTYDTGGYSLKVNNGMKGMKYDKCGGAAVLGAMHAIASLKLPVHVYGLLTCAENMVSDDSYRPDDIITMYNGITVEVTNTDAEGRLVLADALTYACRDLKASAIVELSTLTGGIVTALGHFCAGMFCNDDSLRGRIDKAAEAAGENVWRMPLWKEHREFMRAQHADLLNSNPSRNAHPIQGAAFLDYFVDEGIPFAHLDIAAMGNVEKDTDLFCTGPTGWGVRLLTQLVEGYGG